jgi:hypothetical protein
MGWTTSAWVWLGGCWFAAGELPGGRRRRSPGGRGRRRPGGAGASGVHQSPTRVPGAVRRPRPGRSGGHRGGGPRRLHPERCGDRDARGAQIVGRCEAPGPGCFGELLGLRVAVVQLAAGPSLVASYGSTSDPNHPGGGAYVLGGDLGGALDTSGAVAALPSASAQPPLAFPWGDDDRWASAFAAASIRDVDTSTAEATTTSRSRPWPRRVAAWSGSCTERTWIPEFPRIRSTSAR